MNALAATTQASPVPAQATPQLRTLLLTDLVDSTGTVERLGDGPSAELFRAHDRLVLDLQQRWRGRLIDRSDGLLLMFERAVDGLGFALDYNRGLRELGKAHGVPLQARAGLHVGEVLTWRNSAEAVAVGAKPLEVEGLAKPLAGRLLGLARPGQILLSATAEALAHRAARELGERGAQLAWKSHGRWRFKGLPEPLEVYEAGEPGLAPLQAPRPDAKAWRDIPFWRRPAALAAELALAAVVAIGIWFFTRPQPAIAFSERDWVVVADMRNLTGQPVLDDALQQAFRISLEQSRHVNVLSDLKARDTLARMQRQPGTALDREIASEIAVRDGARAVILPTVAEVGGRVRVSAEVIDPQSQTTVYAEYADGSGLDSVLASVDAVTAALRARLGEEIKAIERDSEPLPQVTTSNLDALRAYALAEKAFSAARSAEAIALYKRAFQLDSEFALAHIGIAREYAANDQPARALLHIRVARELRDRLTNRDKLYLDAWWASFGPVSLTLEKWKLLSDLYPDYFAGHYNYAHFAETRANEYRPALELIERGTSEKNPNRGWTYHQRATLRTALNDFLGADSDFARADALNATGAGLTRAASLAARRRFEETYRALQQASGHQTFAGAVDQAILKAAIAVDEGRMAEAAQQVRDAASAADDGDLVDSLRIKVIGLGIRAAHARDDDASSDFASTIEASTKMLSGSDYADRPQVAFNLLAAAYLAGRAGHHSLLDDVAQAGADLGALGYPLLDDLLLVLAAEKQRLSGRPGDAVNSLKSRVRTSSLYQLRVALMHAYLDAGQFGHALEQAQWLAAHRGQAYIEFNGRYVLQAMNVADSNAATLHAAQALVALGRSKEAAGVLADFDARYQDRAVPDYLRDLRAEVGPVDASSL